MTVWVPLTCILYIFDFYICDLRPGRRRDLSIINQWKKVKMPDDPCERIGTVQLFRNHDDLEQSRWPRCIFSQYPLERSSEVIGGYKQCFVNNSWLKEIEHWGWLPCVRLIKTHRLYMQYDLFRSLRDLDLRSYFYLDLAWSNNTAFEASLWETGWCHCRFLIVISSKVIRERIFRP